MIFRTVNSLYELDTDLRRIRQIVGPTSATEWRHFYQVAPIKLGQPATIFWDNDENPEITNTTCIIGVDHSTVIKDAVA